MASSAVARLEQTLQRSPQWLQLVGSEFDEDCYALLAQTLRTGTHFMYVSLTDMDLTAECVEALLAMLETNPALNTLRLTDIGLGTETREFVVEISRILSTNQTLTDLSLVCVGVYVVELGQLLAEGFMTNSTLTNLDLSHNVFDAGFLAVLAEGFMSNTTLTNLNLIGDQIHREDLAVLSNWLTSTSCSLTSLNLRENSLRGDDEATAMTDIIKMSVSLQELHLDAIELNGAAGREMAEALGSNTALTYLDLDLSNFLLEGCTELARGLKKNKGLIRLSLPRSAYSPDCLPLLEDVLRDNGRLLILEENGTAISGSRMHFLRRRLDQNATLRFYTIPTIAKCRFHLDGNEVCEDNCQIQLTRAIGEHMEACAASRHLGLFHAYGIAVLASLLICMTCAKGWTLSVLRLCTAPVRAKALQLSPEHGPRQRDCDTDREVRARQRRIRVTASQEACYISDGDAMMDPIHSDTQWAPVSYDERKLLYFSPLCDSCICKQALGTQTAGDIIASPSLDPGHQRSSKPLCKLNRNDQRWGSFHISLTAKKKVAYYAERCILQVCSVQFQQTVQTNIEENFGKRNRQFYLEGKEGTAARQLAAAGICMGYKVVGALLKLLRLGWLPTASHRGRSLSVPA
eukprot:6207432-Pleurochrysis_carterae.AAC.1